MIKKSAYQKITQAFGLFCIIMLSANTYAAPGTLPDSPLFLTNAVEPNVFYTIDDSGSMEWEVMTANGTAGLNSSSGIATFRHSRYYVIPTTANGYDGYYSEPNYPYTVPSTNLYPLTWVIRNSVGNNLYYNPEIEYKPWTGSDGGGATLYDDADPSNALVDPNDAGFGTIDLTSDINYTTFNNNWVADTIFPATYFTWEDTDNDGEIEDSDVHTRIEIRPANAPFPTGRDYDDEILNFANWFQYYRKRSYVAKAALGQVIHNTDATRMGLDIYNAGHQKDASSMTDPANKSDLLDTLYNLGIYCGPGKNNIYPNSCSGTPARESLDRVGKLFEGRTGNPSPIQTVAAGGECQQNFNILMSDGYWNGSEPGGIGNADRDSSNSANNGYDGDDNESKDNGNYEDNFNVTLADVAMHYYERDLNTTLDDKVPTIAGTDIAEHQHMVTYTIGFGLKGTLDPLTDDPVAGGPGFWPNPMDRQDDERVDDLWHAAYNGRGEYLNAQDPEQLQNSLNIAIQDIADRTATAAAVAVNSARLTQESVVYLAQFNSNRWQGNLFAFPIVDLELGTLSDDHKWEANTQLTARDISADGNPREIITYNGKKGVPFQWDDDLSTEMKNDLRTNPTGELDVDAVAEARLEYLRGNRSDEGAGYQFRPRQTLLGDLVNSGPVYVGQATLGWPDADPFPTGNDGYSKFKEGLSQTRKKIVYTGSNDGMLHAFDDDTGEEVFAYVPNLISSTDITEGYHYLTNPDYTHNWYVDLTPTLSDIHYDNSWHTILIGGLRGGGRGVFALDVTNPANFEEDNADEIVMWEFSSKDDDDLGYTYSRPTIALTNDERWVAIFGNGYNDSGDGEAKLFILDIKEGIDGWDAGDYIEITTKEGSPDSRNGLASPALADIDGNGTVDRVYAGDLLGNMWVFDLSSANSDRWASAFKSGANPDPLFTTPGNQPLTAKPVLAKHPTIPFQTNPSNSPNLMVFFGTGQYLVDSDKSNTTAQAFYGVWDKGDDSLQETDLIEQTYDPAYTARVLTRNFVDYSSDHGWRFDLPASGERSVTSPIARHDTVFFNTFIPQTDPCSVGGYGYKFAVDMTTGGSPLEPVIDINHDGEIDEDDNEDSDGVIVAIKQEGYLPEPVFIEDLVFTGKEASKVKKLPDIPFGRFSWQELIK